MANAMALFDACIVNEPAEAQELLEGGVRPDMYKTKTGATALIESASLGHLEIVLLLLKHGADPMVRDYEGANALEVASVAGHKKVAEALPGRAHAFGEANKAAVPCAVCGKVLGTDTPGQFCGRCTLCKFCAEHKQCKNEAVVEAEVEVTLVGATGIAAMDSNGLSDPYAVLSCAGMTKKSTCVPKTLSPTWNETFRFQCSRTSGELTIDLYDRDIVGVRRLPRCDDALAPLAAPGPRVP